jgi:ribose transport system substrate-binding protein
MQIRKTWLVGVLAAGVAVICYGARAEETYNPQCFKPAAGH